MIPGAVYENGKCRFRVWAPLKEKMQLYLLPPIDRLLDMQKDAQGYFSIEVEVGEPVIRYFYRPDGAIGLPDPASHFQPEGLHRPSQVVDHSIHEWNDREWRGVPLKELIMYELHVGTFTPQGTFDAIIPRLKDLVDLGVNAIELMPINQFPGSRNWGYDAVHPYAVQNSYGGPEGLKRLIDECHKHGIAVLLDLVFNHLGPEGNYFANYGPYFSDRYRTPWGDSINFDGDWSDGVREFFAKNLIHWVDNYHVDGFRMDAIHMVFDNGAVHFWELCHQELKEAEARCGRKIHLIAESDLNSPRVTQSPEINGFGFDAQWLDDFHHTLYVILHEEGKALYTDYGRIDQLAKAYTDGFVLSGEYVDFRKRKHGRSSAGVPGERFVVFNQNHDQIGNRVKGERLSMLVDLCRQKLAAAAIMLSPYLPLLFMGEEFAADQPFFYFVDHSNAELIKAVQEGRKKEFEKYNWDVEPPDPQDPATFQRSRIKWEQRDQGDHKLMLQWHKELIALRKRDPVLRNFNKNDVKVITIDRKGLVLHRQSDGASDHMIAIFNFSEDPLQYTIPDHSAHWRKILDATDPQWRNEETIDRDQEAPISARTNDVIPIAPLNMLIYRSV